MHPCIDNVKNLMDNGHVKEAIAVLDDAIASADGNVDELYYERGNAYWKLQDWKNCLDSYMLAVEVNPESPAVEARRMVEEILQFFNKDMYNH